MPRQTLVMVSLAAGISTAMAQTALTAAQQMEMVTAHNTWRSEVGVPALTWSTTLADSAQVWANTLKTTQACKMAHSRTAGVGENLFWAIPLTYSDGTVQVQSLSATQAARSWGSEKNDYTYATNSCATGKVCGHYTQVVWKSTTEVGCGKAVCADKSQVWVCQYTPAGNYVGQKPY